MLDAWLAALQGSELALALRFSRWGYAFVNTAHVLGIALLVGAIIPLDLRLLGVWNSFERAALVRVLAPVAAAGLALAVTMGFLLFSVRAVDYAALTLFRVKLLLIGRRRLDLGPALPLRTFPRDGAPATPRSSGHPVDDLLDRRADRRAHDRLRH
ncbi:MAG: hypothetical protein ACR2QH_16365 [Geminicoccaceae bacterium]